MTNTTPIWAITPSPGAREKILATTDTATPADRITRIAEMLAAALREGDMSGIDTLPQALLEIAADMRGPVMRDQSDCARFIEEIHAGTTWQEADALVQGSLDRLAAMTLSERARVGREYLERTRRLEGLDRGSRSRQTIGPPTKA